MRLEAHHIGIIVSDLERSKSFYRSLGFEPVSERDDGTKTICFMALGSFRLELFSYDETVAQPARPVGRVTGFRHLALSTDDMDETVSSLRSAGVLPDNAQVRELPGLARLLFFDDPDGIEVEVMQDLGTGK